MPRTSATRSKKQTQPVMEEVPVRHGEKIIDPVEHIAPIVPEEEVEEDVLANPEAAETEEATLDEEDVNPFGDKWEQ